MHCFNHAESPAVAVCKVCGKGVCPDCAIDKDVAVACCETCAEEALLLHEINQRNKRIYGLAGKRSSMTSGVIMWVLFCVFFMGLGAYMYFSNGRVDPFLLSFGVLCGILGWVAHRRARSIGLQY